MSRWPLGVFSSINVGFGVQLDVAHKLGVTTIHLHALNRELRTPQSARELLQRLGDLGIEMTCVFAGFDGENYADIPTVNRTVGLVPLETRAARTAEFKEIIDFSALLKVAAVGFIWASCRTRSTLPSILHLSVSPMTSAATLPVIDRRSILRRDKSLPTC